MSINVKDKYIKRKTSTKYKNRFYIYFQSHSVRKIKYWPDVKFHLKKCPIFFFRFLFGHVWYTVVGNEEIYHNDPRPTSLI